MLTESILPHGIVLFTNMFLVQDVIPFSFTYMGANFIVKYAIGSDVIMQNGAPTSSQKGNT